ncbi:MAG TPA: hypothetical protein VJ969_09780 [Desulfopila sp.]|nr:hypothetical protein [Desulfopila sp.]
MNTILKTLGITTVLALALVFSGCETEEGPLEETGEAIEETTEKTGDSLEEAADETEEAMEDATEGTD